MATKVFYRCDESLSTHVGVFYKGFEYTAVPRTLEDKFTRIERETFERDGVEWFRHTPGNPMPCDGSEYVLVFIYGLGFVDEARPASSWFWGVAGSICGWRYADAVTVKQEYLQIAGRPQGDNAHVPFSERTNLAMIYHDSTSDESEGERKYREKQEAIRNE